LVAQVSTLSDRSAPEGTLYGRCTEAIGLIAVAGLHIDNDIFIMVIYARKGANTCHGNT
jgi:hypothetical protein